MSGSHQENKGTTANRCSPARAGVALCFFRETLLKPLTSRTCTRSVWSVGSAVIKVALGLAGIAGIASFCSPAVGENASQASAAFEWQETKLGVVPDQAEVRGNALVDNHGWHYGLVVRAPGGNRLWLDGIFQQVFTDFVEAQILDAGLTFDYEFSPDGKHLAYAVLQGDRMHMVVDGQVQQAEEKVERPTFSPDGRHLAYVVRRGGDCLLLDGLPGPSCDNVCGRIQFSPDSHRIAYLVRHGKEYSLVVDQKEEPDWPHPGYPVFSPDGQHIAYTSTTRNGTSFKAFAVLDRRKGPELPASSLWGPVFSSDSQHFAFTSQDSAGAVRHQRAFVDWLPLPMPNNGTGVWHVAFSPDLKRAACILKIADKERVVLDGKEGPVFDGAYGLAFSPDNQRFAYMAQVRTNWWMIVDGKREAEIELDASRPCFSPDGKRLAYIAGRGPVWWMVVDGMVGPKFKGTRGTLGGPSLQQEVELPALTEPQFSPDSRHVTYAALASNQWKVLIDGKAIPQKYETIVRGGPAFHQDGSLEFLGIRNRVLYRIEVTLRKQQAKPRAAQAPARALPSFGRKARAGAVRAPSERT